MKTIHTGWVQDNKLVMDDYFYHDLSLFEGQEVMVDVKPKSRSLSLLMNNYYWGVVVRVLRDHWNSNYTFDKLVNDVEVHELLKSKFLGKEVLVNQDSGEVVEVPVSYKSLSNKDHIFYWESIIEWAREVVGVDIPHPDSDFKNKIVNYDHTKTKETKYKCL